MTAKETLHQIVDKLSEDEATELIDYLNMRADPDALTEEEIARVRAAEAEAARGEYTTFADWRRRRGS